MSEALVQHTSQALRPFNEGATQAKQIKLSFTVRRFADRIAFTFEFIAGVPADLERLMIPGTVAAKARERRDELWKRTCLEIFLGDTQTTSYVEMNLAPSGHWNAYLFDSYREGMRPLEGMSAPLVQVETSVNGDARLFHGEIKADGTNASLVEMLKSPSLVMNATAVLEYATGEREYWALAHAGEKPDFHLREGFRLPL